MALWPELAQLGVIGALFNEDAGGFGGSARDLATIMEAAGRYLVVEPLLATAITGMLLHAAGENVAELIAGSHTIAFAHDEGLDPFAARRSTAVREGEQWRITGTKPAVRHADFADRVLATADVEGGTRCFLLEIDRDEALESIRLMDASSAATLRLEGKSARLLDLPEAVLDLALARAAVGLAAETVGILEALCDKSFAYLNTRKQFGTTLASFQALRHRAADMVAAAEEARALTDRAIDALDHGSLALASAAKALADEAGRLIGHEAVQLHGGMGVSDELDISHYLRRLATIRATLGQSACHRARFASSRPSAAR